MLNKLQDNTEANENKEDTEMTEKVKLLEAATVVQKMFLNVIKLESKVTDSTTKPKCKVIRQEKAG